MSLPEVNLSKLYLCDLTMRTIKRYPNRKLYDLDRKRYVTLDNIAAMIQEGEDVQVIDHENR